MERDKSFLMRAVELAGDSIETGGGPFGAVVTMEGKVISEASNRVVVNKDPTAHAEVLAIRQAASFLKTHDLSSCTLYSSCEPCPMCLGAIYWSGIRKVVYSSDRKDAEAAGFSDNIIYEEIEKNPGARKILFLRLLENEGEKIFRKWRDQENKTPY